MNLSKTFHLLLIAVIGPSFFANAGSYDPLPKGITRYTYDRYEPSGDFEGQTHLILDPTSDSLIGGKIYHPLHLYNKEDSGKYLGGIREKGGALHYIPAGSDSSRLIWDFSVEVGDTLEDLFAYDRNLVDSCTMEYDVLITGKKAEEQSDGHRNWAMDYRVLRYKPAGYDERERRNGWSRTYKEKRGSSEGLLLTPHLGSLTGRYSSGVYVEWRNEKDKLYLVEICGQDRTVHPGKDSVLCEDPSPPFPAPKEEFRFQKKDGDRIKGLDRGTPFDVHLKPYPVGLDTVVKLKGSLLYRTDSTLKLRLEKEKKIINGPNSTRSPSTITREEEYYATRTRTIPKERIGEMTYEPWNRDFFMVPMAVSVSTFCFAPLFAIDKGQPNNFNSRRYITIASISAGSGVLFGIAMTLNDGEIRFPEP